MMSDIFLFLMIIVAVMPPLFVEPKSYLIETYDESIQDITDKSDEVSTIISDNSSNNRQNETSRRAAPKMLSNETKAFKKEIEKKYPGYKLFGGDMILSPNQQKKFVSKSSLQNDVPKNDTKLQQARVGHTWPNNIMYYMFDNTVEEHVKDNIRRALKELAELLNGCVKIAEGMSANYVMVSAVQNGHCVSMVGVNKQFQNTLNLDPTGCQSKGTIQHEFIHSLGIYHHQSRKDRDQYIKINWNNIQTEQENMTHNFLIKEDSDTFNLPYDYDSIMHYGDKDFSKNGAPTIETKNPANQKRIGVHDEISPGDVKLIKAYYKCRGDIKCITDGGAECIFPFIYKRTKYNGCTLTGQSEPWCATVVDGSTRYVKDWGNCASSCKLHSEGLHSEGKFKLMDNGNLCVDPWTPINTEEECIAAAKYLDLVYGKSWIGPNDFPDCLFANDGRSQVYFNKSPNPSYVAVNKQYAGVCKEMDT